MSHSVTESFHCACVMDLTEWAATLKMCDEETEANYDLVTVHAMKKQGEAAPSCGA